MLNPWAFESEAERCTYELLKQLNILNSTTAIQELKAMDAYDLIPPLFTDELKIDFFGSEQFCFVPTIDDEFVTQSPHIISHQQPPSNVPILIGWTSLESEWILSFGTSNFKYPNENVNISSYLSDFMSLAFECDSIEKDRFIQNFQHVSDMSYGIHKFVQNYIKSTEQKNVFLYRFAFDNKFSDFGEMNAANNGAIHGDELKYIFKDNVVEKDAERFNKIDLLYEEDEDLVKQRMVTMWTNFIKFG